MASTTARSRKRVLVLPDDAPVDIQAGEDASQPTKVAIGGTVVCAYRTLPRSLALVVSAIGTPFEHAADHIPKFPLLEILPPSAVEPDADADAPTTIAIADLWGALNVLHTLCHAQDTIPVVLSPALTNAPALEAYLLHSGLARKRHTLPGDTSSAREPELFLLRETFWQGAGTAGFHARGWLRSPAPAPFPYAPSFTRTPLVIAAHPLRPPKPAPGAVVYRKFWPAVGQMLALAHVDLGSDGDDEVSPHLAAFHRWHNSEHVNRGWGERGPMEKHRAYLRALMADPGVLPVMMSWDGELMGYAELVYIKVRGCSWSSVCPSASDHRPCFGFCYAFEHHLRPQENHVAPYVPGGAWDYDRGLHILVGEQKFRGIDRCASRPFLPLLSVSPVWVWSPAHARTT